MTTSEAVITAVQAGDLERLRALVSENPNLACSRDAAGVSALMHAVYRRQTAAIDLLRHAELDVFEAAALGDTHRLLALVARDPSLANTHSSDGFTALHFAAFFSHPDAARILLEHGADPASVARNPTHVMPLHSAAASGNIATVHALLAHGAPINARQQHGWTALHSAAQNGNLELLDLLLQHGADPDLKNDKGVSALDIAQKQGHAHIVNRLAKVQSA